MKFTIKLFSILSFTLCASLCGMDADKQPEAKPAPGSITALIEQRGKNASLQSHKEKLRTQRDLADKFGYGQDFQEDMEAWWGNFSLRIEYSSYCREKREYEAWQSLGRALFSSTDEKEKSPEKKQDEAP